MGQVFAFFSLHSLDSYVTAVRDAGVLEMEEKSFGIILNFFFASSQLLLSTFPNLNRVTMATETRKKSNKLRNNPIKEIVMKVTILV